jgi:hypothetical protein
MSRFARSAVLSLALSGVHCASVLGIEQADRIDENADASGDDAGEGGTGCGAYCDCMGQNCTDRFADETACLSACATYTSSQLGCRTYHCGAASQDPVLHCPHALGINLCQ